MSASSSNNAAVNAPTFQAPILATSIAVPLCGVQLALGLSSILRLAALALVIVMLRTIR